MGYGFPTIPTINMNPIRIKVPSIAKIKLKKIGGTTFDGGLPFEKRVARELKKKGYRVLKRENQHHDLIALKSGKKYYVECKCNTSKLSDHEVSEMHKVVKKGDVYVIARKSPTGRIVLKFLTLLETLR